MTTAPDSLRAAGLRRTPARVQVLGVLGEIGRPLAHAEIAARPEIAGIDPITLYRTLATLEQAGLVHRVHGIDGVWRTCAQPMQQRGCPGNHAHFLCGACRAMQCLVDQPMPRVAPPPGASIEARHFVAVGRCADCVAAKGVERHTPGPIDRTTA